MAAFQFFRRRIQEARGGAVDDGDHAFAVEPDHARAHARQHRLGEAAALFVQLVGGDQIAALGGELLGHAIEGAAQIGELVIGLGHMHLRGEIAFRNALGRVHQTRDRLDQPIGRPDAGPHRAQQRYQRRHDIERGEHELHVRSGSASRRLYSDTA